MKKYGIIIFLFMVSFSTLCQQPGQWNISKVEGWPSLPSPLSVVDWEVKSNQYLNYVLDPSKSGTYLPLMWWDSGYRNINFDTFSLQSYVGHTDQIAIPSGRQEGINCMSTVLRGCYEIN